MKSLFRVIFICILITIMLSCVKKAGAFPQLDPSPLIQSYKINKVYSYTRTVYFNDSIVDKDSVKINPSGYVSDALSVNGQYEETRYTYDALNRIIAKQNKSDISYITKVTGYSIDPKAHVVWQHWETFNTCYKFDNDFRTLKQAVTANSTATLHITNYEYKNNRLVLVTDIPVEGLPTKTVYTYTKTKALATISTGNELQYISAETGLIDSVKTPYANERICYKYYKY